jgi:acetyl/propionyl-CoA carboxylase alpha subunit
MTLTVLIANRGEIALRIIRTATELGFHTVAVYAEDDAESPHVQAAAEAIGLPGSGPPAYLDHAAILAAAERSGATLIHPGYGFFSENPEFARGCAAAGRIFVGPDAEMLELFGDKSSARRAAHAAGLPVPAATEGPTSLADVRGFFATHRGGIMIKALAGGGGRGMRTVRGAEELVRDARHIEVQIVAAPGEHGGCALALGARDCSIQRRYQKLIEIAPAPGLSATTRCELHRAAARLCAHVGYRGIATVEFLLTGDEFTFLEVNPRIQVEHTITEEVTGVDLVAAQFDIAGGAAFGELGLPSGVVADRTGPTGEPAKARGIAIETRVNAETVAADGSVLPTAGTLTAFTPPGGPGVRVDTYGRPGLSIGPRYDSLLAKVITHTRATSLPAAVRKAQSALTEFIVEGVETNIEPLRKVLSHSDLQSGAVTTRWLGDKLPELVDVSKSQRSVPELRPGEQVTKACISKVTQAVM